MDHSELVQGVTLSPKQYKTAKLLLGVSLGVWIGLAVSGCTPTQPTIPAACPPLYSYSVAEEAETLREIQSSDNKDIHMLKRLVADYGRVRLNDASCKSVGG